MCRGNTQQLQSSFFSIRTKFWVLGISQFYFGAMTLFQKRYEFKQRTQYLAFPFLEEYLRNYRAIGIAIDQLMDVILLAYADSILILENSQAHLQFKIKLIEEYCRVNFFQVQIQKRDYQENKFRKCHYLCSSMNSLFIQCSYNSYNLEFHSVLASA